MLRVSLKQLVTAPELLLAKAGVDPEARAETLDVADFANLANALDYVDDKPVEQSIPRDQQNQQE